MGHYKYCCLPLGQRWIALLTAAFLLGVPSRRLSSAPAEQSQNKTAEAAAKSVDLDSSSALTPAERARLKQIAINVYTKIVNDYPDSAHAIAAQSRLNALSTGDR